MTEKSIFNDDMPKARFPYLQKQTTRHGRLNWYVRVNRGPKIRIRGDYGSTAFMDQYHAAIAGTPIKETPENKHSLKWLIDQYKKSGVWEMAKPATKKQRDCFFKQMIDKSGHVPFSVIEKIHIMQGMDDRRKTPAAANNFLKTNRALFTWADDANYIDNNPAADIKKLKYQSAGHSPWNIDDLEKYKEKWKIGSRERLAMELLLWTGLRRGDVVRLGRQHIKNNVGKLPATEKTGVDIFISIPDHLAEIIRQSPTGDLAFIATQKGAPRNKEAFGNWFGKSCKVAGVDKSAHGLRKTAATIMAESGGTGRELMAAFGWKSERMAAFYTLEADRKHLSAMAFNKRLNRQ